MWLRCLVVSRWRERLIFEDRCIMFKSNYDFFLSIQQALTETWACSGLGWPPKSNSDFNLHRSSTLLGDTIVACSRMNLRDRRLICNYFDNDDPQDVVDNWSGTKGKWLPLSKLCLQVQMRNDNSQWVNLNGNQAVRVTWSSQRRIISNRLRPLLQHQ